MSVDILETSNQEYHKEVRNVVFLQGEVGTKHNGIEPQKYGIIDLKHTIE